MKTSVRAVAALALALLLALVSGAGADITRRGNLSLAVSGRFVPHSLARRGTTPIAATVGWHIGTTDGSEVPNLKRLRIEINRHGRFDYAGLPICPYDKIQPASSTRALTACRSALVGKGDFSADVALRGQEPYGAQGRLLVFNGSRNGRPVLLGHIYSSYPFPTSFVITFSVRALNRGNFGTALDAALPKALSSWGNLTGIDMTLSRRFAAGGRRHSYISANCPAPDGFSKAIFPLARTSFAFGGGATVSSTVTGTCRARG
jgi:hypothetical protein